MSYDRITVSDLEIMANAVNYRNWIYHQIEPFIGRKILEIGSGIGNLTELLTDRDCVVATDKYQPCVNYLNSRLGHQLKSPAILMDIANARPAELESRQFDTILCLNVLEHIENDVHALRNMRELLEDRGRLILLVPAFPFLFGSVDRSLEHHRRYTKNDLLPRMREAGFQTERSFFMNVMGMAGWFLNNRILGRGEESAQQIQFFDKWIAPWAERMERIIPPPIGLSLIAIGRKESTPKSTQKS